MDKKADKPIVSFEYNGKCRKIQIDPSAGLEGLLNLVATRWKISMPIELEYRDPATGDEMILDVDDDLHDLFSQNFKWKVIPEQSESPDSTVGNVQSRPGEPQKPAASPASPAKDSGASGDSSTEEDDYDESVEHKKEKWTDLIPDEWECKNSVQMHPFFISYRQAFESAVAENLFNSMEIALLKDHRGSVLPMESKQNGQHAFWDARCLAFGQKWGINFMSGLLHSSVIILLCSDRCMERMVKADRKPDNVLLEWELALQMKQERGKDILPILLSRREVAYVDGRKTSVIVEFQTFDYKMFPNKYHKHPLSPGQQTVRETVKMILELNGPKVHPESDIPKIVTEAREVYSRRKSLLKSGSPSSDISLQRSSLLELERWLSPLSEQMEIERKALLANVLPDSRQWLLRRVFQFLSPDDPAAASPNRVMWLNGVAGVGKSVMAALVSRELQAQSMLGGLFFCKHDDERRNSARNLITTLAFGLAKFSIDFGEALLQVRRDNPDILSRPVNEMTKVLIIGPLKEVASEQKLGGPVVLIVDALDECGAIHKRGEVLLIFQLLNELLPAGVKILITGRPEEDIAAAFRWLPVESIEPTAGENLQDQIDFTRHFLQSLDADPSLVDEGSKILVGKSSGVFVWLATACNYLKNSGSETITMDQIHGLPEGDKLDGNIDAMYDRIFSGLFKSVQERNITSAFGSVLATILLTYEPLTAKGIVSLLAKEDAETVKHCIRLLDPILVLDGQTRKIRIFHKSVKDYLMNSTRCKNPSIQIDSRRKHSDIASMCISAMDQTLKFNMCALPFSQFHTEIADFDNKVNNGVPEHVKYAVKHFSAHCCDSAVHAAAGSAEKSAEQARNDSEISDDQNLAQLVDAGLFNQLKEFIETKGHHFLEACSLINALDLVIPAMSMLQNVAPDSQQSSAKLDSFYVLMKDIVRVVQKFQVPLRSSALQVYFSAVPFSPYDSVFFKTFVGNVPESIDCPLWVKGQPQNWPTWATAIEGHSGTIWCVAFNPDGHFIATASDDSTIKIWNAASGQELIKLDGHTDPAIFAVLSPDGTLIVSGSTDLTVRIWDAHTGRELHQMEGFSRSLSSPVFQADGLFALLDGQEVKLCDPKTGQVVRKIVAKEEVYEFIAALSPDGRFAASGGPSNVVIIWDASTGQVLQKLGGHSEWVNSAAFSPDGEFVVTACQDNTARIWSVSSGQELHKLEGHTHWVYIAAFSPDGRLVATGSRDNSVRLWSASTGRLLEVLEGHTDSIMAISFSPDGRFVATAGVDKTTVIWKIQTDGVRSVLSPDENSARHTDTLHCAAYSPNGELAVSGSADKTARIWDARTGVEVRKLEGHSSDVYCIAFSPDGQLVASGSWDRTVRVWNAASGQAVHVLEGHTDDVFCTAFSCDGRFLASGGRDGLLRVWNVLTGEQIHALEGHFVPINSVAFSPDGQMLASAGYDSTVRTWDASTGALLNKLEGHSEWVYSASFSPDGRQIVTAGGDYTVRVWNALDGRELHKLEGHATITYSAAFSGDGKFVVSEDADGFCKVWSLESGGGGAEVSGDDVGPTMARDNKELKRVLAGVRNAAGDKLQSEKKGCLPVMSKGVWFTEKNRGVTCWLPTELRGELQLVRENLVFTLGPRISGLVQFASSV